MLSTNSLRAQRLQQQQQQQPLPQHPALQQSQVQHDTRFGRIMAPEDLELELLEQGPSLDSRTTDPPQTKHVPIQSL